MRYSPFFLLVVLMLRAWSGQHRFNVPTLHCFGSLRPVRFGGEAFFASGATHLAPEPERNAVDE